MRILKRTGIAEAPVDAGFGPADHRLWVPRHHRERFGGGIVFQRRMPPCGRGGLWAHWDADALLRDFHSDLKVRADGSVLTTHLAVYPGAAAARRWMHQFTNESFGCTFIRTPGGDRSVRSTSMFALGRQHRARGSVHVDQVAGMGQQYRLYNGDRGSVATFAFRESNAVLLVSHWRHHRRIDFESVYTAVERLSRPILEELVRHYARPGARPRPAR